MEPSGECIYIPFKQFSVVNLNIFYPGSETGQLNEPQHLAVDKNGFIFVADAGNNRIVVLDSKLEWSRDLQIDVNSPYSLCLDEQRNQLFVGEGNSENSRVVVVKV